MKKIIQTALLLLAFLLPATALAHDFEVGGIYYKINGDDVEVTYKGTQYNQYTNEYAGHVTIPQTVTYNETTYSVTSIVGNNGAGKTSALRFLMEAVVEGYHAHGINGIVVYEKDGRLCMH